MPTLHLPWTQQLMFFFSAWFEVLQVFHSNSSVKLEQVHMCQGRGPPWVAHLPSGCPPAISRIRAKQRKYRLPRNFVVSYKRWHLALRVCMKRWHGQGNCPGRWRSSWDFRNFGIQIFDLLYLVQARWGDFWVDEKINCKTSKLNKQKLFSYVSLFYKHLGFQIMCTYRVWSLSLTVCLKAVATSSPIPHRKAGGAFASTCQCWGHIEAAS